MPTRECSVEGERSDNRQLSPRPLLVASAAISRQVSAPPRRLGRRSMATSRVNHSRGHEIVSDTARGPGRRRGVVMRDHIFEAAPQTAAVTAVRFVPWIDRIDHVRFRSSDGCSSRGGRQCGRQETDPSNECGLGATIDEFLHAVGLHHEHTRHDRDGFVEIQ